MAIGGNAVIQNFGIGNQLPRSLTRDDLIVGGNMDIQSGTNFNGNSVISPAGTVIRYTMTNNNGVSPQPLRGIPVDFTAAWQYLTYASEAWANVPANGTASNFYGQIRLTGTSPELNVFTINGANVAAGVSLSSANGVNFIVPAGSTILVNVAGNNVGFGSYSIFINGVTATSNDASLILWNFYQATTAFNQNLSIKGSVLAPLALWSPTGYGNIEGTLAVRSFTAAAGNLTGLNVPFAGCLPQVLPSPQLTLRKTVNGAESASGPAGTPLLYAITATNAGAGTLTNVNLSDPLIGVSQTVPELAAGETINLAAQSSIRSGSPGETYSNTVTAVSDQTPVQTASNTITIEGVLNVEFVKTADVLSARPGETVNYSLSIINNGSLPLRDVRVRDPQLGVDLTFDSFFDGTLATLPYTVPANAQAGTTFTNTAELTAGNLPEPLTGRVDIVIEEIPSISMVKTADRSVAVPGETVSFTVRVTNDSLFSTLTNLTLTDPLLGLSQIIPSMAPRTSLIFNGFYLVPPRTPAGTVISNTSVLQSSLGERSASAQITVGTAPLLAIAKTPRSRLFAPGENAVYDIVVSNTGNVPLNQVIVQDQDLEFLENIPVLPIGASERFEGRGIIGLQTPAGTIITNAVTARSDETAPVNAAAEVVVAPFFSLQLQKQVSDLAALPGETIEYTLVLTNASNGPITGIVLADEALGLEQRLERMEINTRVMYEIPFTIPSGLLAGTVLRNVSTAISNETFLIEAEVEITVAPAPALSLQKLTNVSSALPGQAVTYTITAVNSGNVTLTGISIADPDIGVEQSLAQLVPGATYTVQASFLVPLLPVDTVLTNVASAIAAELEAPVEASASISIGATPLPLLTKVSSVSEASPDEDIQFQITLTNTAPVPLTNVALADSLVRLTDLISVLLPNETKLYLLTYRIPANAAGGSIIENQIEARSDQTTPVISTAALAVRSVPRLSAILTVDAALAEPEQSVTFSLILENTGNVQLTNIRVEAPLLSFLTVIPSLQTGAVLTLMLPYTVPAAAQPGDIIVNETTVSSEETAPQLVRASIEVIPRQIGDIEIVKTASTEQAAPGDVVIYTINLYNPSTVPVTGIFVSDPALGVNETIAVLLPEANTQFLVPFAVPENAVAGSVLINTVIASADEGIVRSDAAEISVLPVPRLTVSKSASVQSAVPGETIVYTITVANEGNTPLTNVSISDSLLGLATVLPLLAIGASQSIELPYVVPALPEGAIIANFAAAASDQTPQVVTAEADVSVGAAPSLLLSKTVQPAIAVPGEEVTYTITVTNPNAFNLTNVQLVDAAIGLRQVIPTLLPGTSKVVQTASAIPDGTLPQTPVVNTAAAFSDQTPVIFAEAVLELAGLPALQVRAMSDRSTARPGQVVLFRLTVTNTGNITLNNVSLQDVLLQVDEQLSELPPQGSLIVSVPYAIPQDALAGQRILCNTLATSDETLPRQAVAGVTVAAVTSVVIESRPSMPSVIPGNNVTFTTTITNTSNQTLSNLLLTDTLLGLTARIPSLAIGQTITLVTEYSVPLNARLDSYIINQLTLTSNNTPLSSAESSVLVLPYGGLSLNKRMPVAGLQGEMVPYVLLLRNTGNITLNGIVLNDPTAAVSLQIESFPYAALQTLRGFLDIPPDTPIGTVIANSAVVLSEETGRIAEEAQLVVLGLEISKSSSSLVAFVGERIQYRVVISNTIGYPAFAAVLRDSIPAYGLFVAGSASVNGAVLGQAQLSDGIPLGAIAPGQQTTVTYEVALLAAPRTHELANQARVSYQVRFPDRIALGASVSNIWTIEVFEDEE